MHEEPDTTPVRKLAVIMFTDIVGYTALMGSNEDKAFRLLRKNREIHHQKMAEFNGTLIKEMGDGMLISFELATDAVRCAIALQNISKVENIPLKIGIHLGEMVFEGEDVLGDGVNVASRLQEYAKEGRICISGDVFNAIRNKPGIKTRFLGHKKLKNLGESVQVYEVLSEEELNPTNNNQVRHTGRLIYYIIGGGMAMVIIAFMIWNYLPIYKKSSISSKEKSIAVLSFENLSPEVQNDYFVNGMIEDIRNNLSKIGDFRVISKTSTEIYKGTTLNIREIAKELNVNFVLEGTVTRIGDQVKIHAQLIDGETDGHIWSDTYVRELSDVFGVQSEIARIIANELYSTITPEEQNIIDKPPTNNMLAYEKFNQARQYYDAYLMDGNSILGIGILAIRSEKTDLLDMATSMYLEALDIDTTFAQAYSGMGMALAAKYDKQDQINVVADSLLFLARKALSYNSSLDEAYLLQGIYYRYARSRIYDALENLEKAVEINPSYAAAYLEMGSLYIWEKQDFVEGIKNLYRAYDLDKSYLFPLTVQTLYSAYLNLGFFIEAESYRNEFFKLDKQIPRGYYGEVAWAEWCKNDIMSSIQWAQKTLEEDSLNRLAISFLAFRYSYARDIENANKYFKLHVELFGTEDLENRSNAHRLGYSFYLLGNHEEAMKYFNLGIELGEVSIEEEDLSTSRGFSFYDLFAIYTFLEDYDKAFEYLRSLRQVDFYPTWLMTYFYHDPLIDKVRDDQRFKDFLQEAELKLQREQDRVKSWMETEEKNPSIVNSDI